MDGGSPAIQLNKEAMYQMGSPIVEMPMMVNHNKRDTTRVVVSEEDDDDDDGEGLVFPLVGMVSQSRRMETEDEMIWDVEAHLTELHDAAAEYLKVSPNSVGRNNRPRKTASTGLPQTL